MGYAFVFRSNSLAGAAVPPCIGSTHGRTGLGLICPRRDETRREHSLELLSRLGVEQFGTKHYLAISPRLECLTSRKSRWAKFESGRFRGVRFEGVRVGLGKLLACLNLPYRL